MYTMSYYGVDAIVDASLASSETGRKILVARTVFQYIVLTLFLVLIIYAIAKGGKNATGAAPVVAKSPFMTWDAPPSENFCCGY